MSGVAVLLTEKARKLITTSAYSDYEAFIQATPQVISKTVPPAELFNEINRLLREENVEHLIVVVATDPTGETHVKFADMLRNYFPDVITNIHLLVVRTPPYQPTSVLSFGIVLSPDEVIDEILKLVQRYLRRPAREEKPEEAKPAKEEKAETAKPAKEEKPKRPPGKTVVKERTILVIPYKLVVCGLSRGEQQKVVSSLADLPVRIIFANGVTAGKPDGNIVVQFASPYQADNLGGDIILNFVTPYQEDDLLVVRPGLVHIIRDSWEAGRMQLEMPEVEVTRNVVGTIREVIQRNAILRVGEL